MPCAPAARACAATHLLPRAQDGALLMELFTHEGVGTMLTREELENVRPAKIEDVGGILSVIEPLENDGVLVRRSRERLEQEIEQFFVDELDGRIVGCVALYPFSDTKARERWPAWRWPRISAVAAAATPCWPPWRKPRGRGGWTSSSCSPPATAHWFIERGFVLAGPDDLPAPRKAMYNWQRRSKVLVKPLPAET
jgi:amino-acid N-acetyltransferase